MNWIWGWAPLTQPGAQPLAPPYMAPCTLSLNFSNVSFLMLCILTLCHLIMLTWILTSPKWALACVAQPWPVWYSDYSISSHAKGSKVQFPVKARTWVAGSISGLDRGPCRRQPIDVTLLNECFSQKYPRVRINNNNKNKMKLMSMFTSNVLNQ